MLQESEAREHLRNGHLARFASHPPSWSVCLHLLMYAQDGEPKLNAKELVEYFQCYTKDCRDAPVVEDRRHGRSLASLFPQLRGGVSDKWKQVGTDFMSAAAEIPLEAAAAGNRATASSAAPATEAA